MAKITFALYGDYGGRQVECCYGSNNLTYTDHVDGTEVIYEDRAVSPDGIAAQLKSWEAPDGLIHTITKEMERQERIGA